MRLDALLRELPDARLVGDGAAEIRSLSSDSRSTLPGALFAAIPGVKQDGAAFAADAAARGAVALLAEKRIENLSLPQLLVPDARAALALAAESFYRHPSRRLDLVGVTGTNGKTTTAFLLRHILASAGQRAGLMGTVIYDDGTESRPAPLTTPGSIDFFSTLARMVEAGCSAAVVEVSSHALDQRRVEGARFRAALFTNLTRDHLDYHGDMDRYAAAKARLFALLDKEGTAVVNRDDPYASRLAQAAPGRVIGYSIESESDLRARIRTASLEGTEFEIQSPSERALCRLPLAGRYNVANALASFGGALALGLPLSQAVAAAESFGGVPGRLERIPAGEGIGLFVDYAHTDDALRNVLAVLRPLTRARLILVFGCGGDRDRGKRPLMAKAAEAAADSILVTNDNPRTEDPDRIFDDIRAGFARPGRIRFEPDRARAVAEAVRMAGPGDAVLVAGKGHEDYQILGAERIHLDDRELLRAAWAERSPTGRRA